MKKIIIILVIIVISSFVTYCFISESEPQYRSNEYSSEENDNCNVLGIELYGDLYTYILEDDTDVVSSNDIIWQIEDANNDDDIEAIIIEVDSYGGLPVAGEEIANAIKKSNKPVVAVIRNAGLSASYWAVSSSDYIFASKNSDVGSIGVTVSYLENTLKNQKEGLTYIQLSSAKFKDAGSPDKNLTQEEKNILMRDLEIVHQNFVEAVSENRNIELEKVKEIADGSSVLGEQAKNLGLIDKIGDFYSAKEYVENLIGEDVGVCWY